MSWGGKLWPKVEGNPPERNNLQPGEEDSAREGVKKDTVQKEKNLYKKN